jgi:hypothetical protein
VGIFAPKSTSSAPHVGVGSGSMTFSNLVLVFGLIAFSSFGSVIPGSAVAATGNFDGPAELPRESVKSSLADTRSEGKTWMVHAGESVERALSQASCGDVVQLQAGATFSGNVVVPARNCDDQHWITIRTSAPDSSLPPEGTRITPCYAGIESLPGRPPLKCASVVSVLAKIEFNGRGGSGPITFAAGANHYRLIGLEVTRAASSATVYNLFEFQGPADHLVFDRLWVHGTPRDETVRGILLGGSRYVAVVDSFFTDFHCVGRSGACTDSQAIAGGIGENPMGPYKILNNFLEAAGENIMFGGGHATVTPQDIEVRRNHMFKPITWLAGQAGFVGGVDGNPFIVKNLFELKNAQRVLLEGNILENTWGGFSQVGFAVLLTPKNQEGRLGNLCPSCQVTDVTIRYNRISHVGAGMQIANGLSDKGAAALDGQRYSIHDITIDDMDAKKYEGAGEFAQVSMGSGAAVLRNVSISHITAFPAKLLFIIGAQFSNSARMENFVFTNNIVNAGIYPVWSTGAGGATNCAVHNSPRTTFEACFNGYAFAGNAIIAPPTNASEGNWPDRNFFPSSPAAVKFVNYNGGNGGDYHLQSSSRYKRAGTDGKDIGADVDAIDAAIAGVE